MSIPQSELSKAVERFILSRPGSTTVFEILEVVGKLITREDIRRMSERASFGGTKGQEARVNLARRRLVTDILKGLVRRGKVARLKRGTYGLPELKQTKVSFKDAVEAAVLRIGTCDAARVVLEVGHLIEAPRALRRAGGHQHQQHATLAERVASGRKSVVNNALGELARRGKIQRVRPGVYAPPTPKLYQPDEKSA